MHVCAPDVLHAARLGCFRHELRWELAGILPGSPAAITGLAHTTHFRKLSLKHVGKREIENLLFDSHQKGKLMIMIMKTPGSQVDSPVAEGNRKEGGGRKMRDLHKDTW